MWIVKLSNLIATLVKHTGAFMFIYFNQTTLDGQLINTATLQLGLPHGGP